MTVIFLSLNSCVSLIQPRTHTCKPEVIIALLNLIIHGDQENKTTPIKIPIIMQFTLFHTNLVFTYINRF